MKGVSPVVATVLMVAVAIAAAVVAYSWFMSMQASVQAEASRGAGTVGKEELKIDAVYCDGSNNLIVALRNLGSEKVTGKFSVYVRDAATGEVNAQYICTKTFTIDAKQMKPFNVNSAYDCNSTTTAKCDSFPDRIIVEVHAPGGAVVSAQQRIR